MQTVPDWVSAYSDSVLKATFGRDTYARGRDYAAQERVQRIDIGRGGGDTVVAAKVRGSRGRAYQTVIRREPTGNPPALMTTCSCPMRYDCKHVVAVLIQLRRGSGRAPTSAWQRVLAELTAETSQQQGGQPLGIRFTRTGRGPGGAAVQIRPLAWGKSGRWITSGATWDRVASEIWQDYKAEHLQALRALANCQRDQRLGYYTYGVQNTEILLSDFKSTVWQALREARDAGVAFVSGPDTPPVRLVDEPAAVLVSVEGSRSAGIEIRPTIAVETVPTGTSLLTVGNPAHGVLALAADELVLAEFATPLSPAQRTLLTQHSQLRIPAAEVDTFVGEFYPMLSRLGRVQVAPGLELPEVAPPILTCQVMLRRNHTSSIRFGFGYGVGERLIEVGLVPDPGDKVVRDERAERELVALVPYGPWRTSSVTGDELHAIDLAARDTIRLAAEVLPALQASDRVRVTVEGEVIDYREAEAPPLITVSVGDPGVTDWFDLSVDVTVAGEKVPFAPLFTALALNETHLVLDSGIWFSLDRPELEQLRQLIAEAQQLAEPGESGLRLRVEHAGLWEELVSLGVVAEQSGAWTAAVSGLLNLDQLPEAAIPAGLQATLRPYQEAGFRWLSTLWTTRLGGILADDMGLGKTLQALALLLASREREPGPPALVIAPTSVLGTWASEAARFAPGLRVRVVGETFARRGIPLDEVIADADVVVTSYTLVRLGEDEYAARDWSVLVLDEAQFVKNRQAKVYQVIRKLRARTKFAVTGTPLENNLMDLWSLLSITCPGLFPNPDRFTESFRRPIESGDTAALARLHRRIRPLMLRRTKESVAAELPPKQEQLISVSLSPAHRRIYDRRLQAERKKVLGLVGDVTKNRIAILRSLTVLRQLSLSPALVDDGPPHSAKIDTLLELLDEVRAEGHRALVFSQFTSFLALVKQRLAAEKIGFQYLDGRTRNRADRIEAFRGGTDPVFLISLKAGGFGLTLTEADYVFILDPWWNPAAELQAIDRTHRIGQDKHVMVYRLVSADTIEEKVVALQQHKRDLFAKVVGADGDLAAPLNAADIRGLLEL